MEKERLDILLVKKGLQQTRERARSVIMAGSVFVDGQLEDKPGTRFHENCDIRIKEPACRYVSRGGLKLEKAVKAFGIDVSGLETVDIGASTGGFTDCMLKNGAARVTAVDVGYGQFAWELRRDPRVVCMERINARYLKPEDIGGPVDFAAIDVSFISLSKILPAACGLVKPEGGILCLVKPQFEAGREKVGKHGVVKDPTVHSDVIMKVAGSALSLGLMVKGMDFSPVKGPEGNIEYLLYFTKTDGARQIAEIAEMADDTVKAAHAAL